ncbi:hypothetical protein N0V93_004122 [Gnomoniopsis smithogilvyi]|uniref:Secreted protein n=1 Tax=Gnomoniopsis smithogilvyi TaxID=1191159 RepID=A0A9W9D0J4_9PEZI|nr:hypothetical protein N0V93_004122 [Gnomoniopsis smithogilvyi]
MRFLITIFIASTIFAPSLAAPSRVAQNDHLLAYDRRTSPKTPPKQNITPGDVPSVGNEGPFKLDDHLNSWLSDESTKKKVYYADSTDGGWEGWAQFEFEVYLRNEMSYSSNKRVREIQVYDGNSKAADFTIEPSQQENRKGMVVELKCENKNSLAGTKVATAFAEDIKKLQGKLKTPYAGSDKVAIVMAYSKEAKDKLDAMKNQNVISISIPTVTVGESQLPLKVYRWDPENDTKDDTELVTDDMSKLGFSDIKCKRDRQDYIVYSHKQNLNVRENKQNPFPYSEDK